MRPGLLNLLFGVLLGVGEAKNLAGVIGARPVSLRSRSLRAVGCRSGSGVPPVSPLESEVRREIYGRGVLSPAS